MALLFSLGLALLMAFAPARAAAELRAVVELFTSQGCSSCRAADAYFVELAERDDVLALSLHVDSWDYLGWPDTFGLPENTARQREYAAALGTRRIYTPQLIINGATDLVGTDRAAVEAAIAASALRVPVGMRVDTGTVGNNVGARPLPGNVRTTIWLVLYSSEASVAIATGENAGATVSYRNVVRAMRPIGMWDGGPVSITLPMDELISDGIDGCAVIVQVDGPQGPGAILGAAKLDRW